MAVMLNGIGKKLHLYRLEGLHQCVEEMIFFANIFELIRDWIAAAVARNWRLKHSVMPIFHLLCRGFNGVSGGLQHSKTIFFVIGHKMVPIRLWQMCV